MRWLSSLSTALFATRLTEATVSSVELKPMDLTICFFTFCWLFRAYCQVICPLSPSSRLNWSAVGTFGVPDFLFIGAFFSIIMQLGPRRVSMPLHRSRVSSSRVHAMA